MKKLFILFCLSLILGADVFSQQAPQSLNLDVKGGLLLGFPGKVNIEGYQSAFQVSPVLKLDLDGILVEKFSMGVSFLYTPAKIDAFTQTGNIITLAMTIKPRFTLSNGSQIRPGLAIGYNNISNSDMPKSSDGLDVGFTLEVTFPIKNQNYFVTEFGFISQPVGGTGDESITFPPVFYLMIGYEFAK